MGHASPFAHDPTTNEDACRYEHVRVAHIISE